MTYRILLQLGTGIRQSGKLEWVREEIALPLHPASEGIVQLDEQLPRLEGITHL